MTFQTRDDAYEPAHTASQTAHALEELQLYGYRPLERDDAWVNLWGIHKVIGL